MMAIERDVLMKVVVVVVVVKMVKMKASTQTNRQLVSQIDNIFNCFRLLFFFLQTTIGRRGGGRRKEDTAVPKCCCWYECVCKYSRFQLLPPQSQKQLESLLTLIRVTIIGRVRKQRTLFTPAVPFPLC